jgi:hypothetical protein
MGSRQQGLKFRGERCALLIPAKRRIPTLPARPDTIIVRQFRLAEDRGFMDAALVRIILTAVAENNPSAIQPREPEQAVAWLKQHTWLKGSDKEREAQYHPEIEAAARAAEQAFAHFRRGEVEAAKPLALEALKMFTG